MSTNRSVGRLTATQDKNRIADTHKKDRSGLCSFTFADGRQCRTPRKTGHSRLCFFHAQKEAIALAAKQTGEDVAYFLSGRYLSACDLTAALGRLFSSAVKGEIKPKTATALAYLGQTLNHSIQLAQDEYINAFGTETWRKDVRSSVSANHALHAPTPQSPPAPATSSASATCPATTQGPDPAPPAFSASD